MCAATSLDQPSGENVFGKFLRDRRTRIDPATLGLTSARRRTPGLRREEVALRADISAAWYIWLEQGRGGTPSDEVLDRLAQALLLTPLEREYLFALAQRRTSTAIQKHSPLVDERIQRILDRLDPAPAMVRNSTWDILALNRAAALFWPMYEEVPPAQRNALRFLFLDERARAVYDDWEDMARTVVSIFRVDVTKAGVQSEAGELVCELISQSSDFEHLWRENGIAASTHAVKTLRQPLLGGVQFEVSSFGVDLQADVVMLVFLPLSPGDNDRICGALQP